ncbi:hypothetical protein SAMN05216167_11048 [Spirosoma endophyticum]|uniref:Uncharacterized protein n=1 Tax=Spirosoma endophyticum TaxID=662367 RepID=A0A1I1XM01_9BACT|nr:hypothetical protein SAMN05216167_11048 [Spirosoma endophyticum]
MSRWQFINLLVSIIEDSINYSGCRNAHFSYVLPQRIFALIPIYC